MLGGPGAVFWMWVAAFVGGGVGALIKVTMTQGFRRGVLITGFQVTRYACAAI